MSGDFSRIKYQSPQAAPMNHESAVAQAAPVMPMSKGPMKRMSKTTLVMPLAAEAASPALGRPAVV